MWSECAPLAVIEWSVLREAPLPPPPSKGLWGRKQPSKLPGNQCRTFPEQEVGVPTAHHMGAGSPRWDGVLAIRKQSQEPVGAAHVAKEGNVGEVEAWPTPALPARSFHACLTPGLGDWKKRMLSQFSVVLYY